MDIAELKKKIVSEIRRDTNGAVVDTMRQMAGEHIYISYGVTLPSIKKVAALYHPNHELALSLFDSQVREAKLAAVYIDTPEHVTVEQMKHWAMSFDSSEIADNCAMMLFWAADEALEVALGWLIDNKNSSAALMMIGKRALMAYRSDEAAHYIKALNIVRKNNDTLTKRGVIYLLTALAKADDGLKSKVTDLLFSSLLPEEITDEVSWQIEL